MPVITIGGEGKLINLGFIPSERKDLHNSVILEVDRYASKSYRFSINDGSIYIEGVFITPTEFKISKVLNNTKNNALQIFRQIFEVMEPYLIKEGVSKLSMSCVLPLVFVATKFLGFKATEISEEELVEIIKEYTGKKVGYFGAETIRLEKTIG